MDRIESVDFFRLLAIIAVISIHTHAYGQAMTAETYHTYNLVIFVDQFARFAVPFFFTISGYFWGVKARKTGAPLEVSLFMAKRIFFILFVWSAFYLLPLGDFQNFANGPFQLVKEMYWNALKLASDPLTLIMQGTKIHLWFLVGLLWSVAISSILVKYNRIRILIVLSIALYATGLLAKSYSFTPFGIHVDFNTRNGPFFGTIFFVSGYVLSSLKPDETWLAKGLIVMGVGYVMHFTELYVIWRHYGQSPFQDYVIGTYFMGIGAAMASLSNHRLFRFELLGKIGQLTLGIYVIHLAFADMLRQYFKTEHLNWGLYFLAVWILSLTTVMILSLNRFSRKLVI